MKPKYVICILPTAGLGNKLLVWARAVVFAELNGFELLVSPWYQISIGPLLRGQRQSRFYVRQLKSQGFLAQIRRLYLLRRGIYAEEPAIEKLQDTADTKNRVYLFKQNPHWSDFFVGIKHYRNLILRKLHEIVPEQHQHRVESLDVPVIAVHIRRGDFRELKPDEDFSRVGLVRTPLGYFVDLIQKIRQICGFDVPVTVFSDGYPEEFQEVLSLPEVHFSTANEPIVDLLLMAKSKVIIFSAGSTFSQWAGFLSNAALVHHPQHFHSPARSDDINQRYFEGPLSESVDDYPELFVKNLLELSRSDEGNR